MDQYSSQAIPYPTHRSHYSQRDRVVAIDLNRCRQALVPSTARRPWQRGLCGFLLADGIQIQCGGDARATRALHFSFFVGMYHGSTACCSIYDLPTPLNFHAMHSYGKHHIKHITHHVSSICLACDLNSPKPYNRRKPRAESSSCEPPTKAQEIF